MVEITMTSDELEKYEHDMEAIYSSVPEKAFKEKNGSKDRIKELLNEKPGTFYSVRVIAEYAGYPVRGTCVETRKAITEILEIEHYPVVSTVKGYAKVTCPEMINHGRNLVFQRLLGLRRRMEAYDTIWNNMMRSK